VAARKCRLNFVYIAMLSGGVEDKAGNTQVDVIRGQQPIDVLFPDIGQGLTILLPSVEWSLHQLNAETLRGGAVLPRSGSLVRIVGLVREQHPLES
jgi:hypothetical protein